MMPVLDTLSRLEAAVAERDPILAPLVAPPDHPGETLEDLGLPELAQALMALDDRLEVLDDPEKRAAAERAREVLELRAGVLVAAAYSG